MKKLIIFGCGQIAELAYYYFTNDSEREVAFFAVDEEYKSKDSLFGLAVVAFDNIESKFPPDKYDMFIALSYSSINKLREKKYNEAKEKGYSLINYISSKATVLTADIGDNCFILEDNTIQPFSSIGNNVTLWSGNHIGHHSIIHDNVFISSHVVISGACKIGRNSFIGVNATLRNDITIGNECVIGAGAWINKSIEDRSVYVATPTEKYKRTSDQLRSL